MKEHVAQNPGRQEKHALAIARWEDNRESWLEGEYFGLASNKPYLQYRNTCSATHPMQVAKRP